MVLLVLACALVSFLIGGIPFGFLAGRLLLGDDIRRHGSGNIGATNVWRVLGWKAGVLVLLLDALKGMLPVLAAGAVMRWAAVDDRGQVAPLMSGLAAIFGHMYPVWLGLRGGKGVATALGAVLVAAPLHSAAALVVFVLSLAVSRMVSLASILAALGFLVFHLQKYGMAALSTTRLPLTVFSLIVPAVIIWRHRTNLVRIVNGTERRIGGSKRPPEEQSQP
ncbi:MAG: glycerol-3-phosphate 1-O-acyltransferase PlsY [Planctomyces sp.]|jgi:glycerol-3-phosphate acyltransferase PlsY